MREEDKHWFLSLRDADLMGLCIEREAGGEPREGKIAVGTVILERVDHRDWDGKTIHEVILKRWQFSWTMPEAGKEYYEESVKIAREWVPQYMHRPTLQECVSIAQDMIDGTLPRDVDLEAAHCCEYVSGAFRKHMDAHPEIKGNRWWQKMKLLKVVGGHEFYVRAG